MNAWSRHARDTTKDPRARGRLWPCPSTGHDSSIPPSPGPPPRVIARARVRTTARGERRSLSSLLASTRDSENSRGRLSRSSCASPNRRHRATTRRTRRMNAETMTCTVARVDTTTRRERRARCADIIAKSVTVARTGWRSARRGDEGTPSSRSSTSFCVWGRSSTRVERRCCWRVEYER